MGLHKSAQTDEQTDEQIDRRTDRVIPMMYPPELWLDIVMLARSCWPVVLKSLGPIDRKFHRHSENDGFVLSEYVIKQFSTFSKLKYKLQC